MNNGNNKSSGAFFNGFLLGLIIGAGAVFLFGTKRGKRILKTITEEGFDGITLTDFLEDEDEEIVEKPKKKAKEVADLDEAEEELEGISNGISEEPTFQTVATKAKRLFRGIPKRKN